MGDRKCNRASSRQCQFPVGTAFAQRDLSRPLGGLQGGFNWQVSKFVFSIRRELRRPGPVNSAPPIWKEYSKGRGNSCKRIKPAGVETGGSIARPERSPRYAYKIRDRHNLTPID